MLRWLEPKLKEKLASHTKAVSAMEEWESMTPLQQAHLNFSLGNAEPLRRHYIEQGDPETARLLKPPALKKRRPQKRGRPAKDSIKTIVAWAKIIREIWNEHEDYRNKQRRSPDWPAVQFAYVLFMMEFFEGFDPNELRDDWLNRASEQIRHGK
jgi:hypothetical protein